MQGQDVIRELHEIRPLVETGALLKLSVLSSHWATQVQMMYSKFEMASNNEGPFEAVGLPEPRKEFLPTDWMKYMRKLGKVCSEMHPLAVKSTCFPCKLLGIGDTSAFCLAAEFTGSQDSDYRSCKVLCR